MRLWGIDPYASDRSNQLKCTILFFCIASWITSWITWVWRQIESAANKERLQTVFMAALEESIVKGGGNREGVMKLLETSKAKLEETTSELLMLALLDIMGATAKHWGQCFKTIFTEVVDIVVGWFMESVNMPDAG